MTDRKKISIVIPAYNEEASLPRLIEDIETVLCNTRYAYNFIIIDDGSTDGTLACLRRLAQNDKNIHYISLSRNFGHQNALLCGIKHSDGDCVLMLDADFQHPPEKIPQMIEKWAEGFQLVYMTRDDSASSNIFKKATSSMFYKLMNYISDVQLEYGVADFRIIDKTVVNEIKKIDDPNLFLRGLIHWLGFSAYKISYQPAPRLLGSSKYNLRRMLSLAFDGITSFSIKPLYLSTLFGSLFSMLAFLYASYALYAYFFTDKALPGWASIIISVLFIGGVQLIMMGVMGVYLGKLFIQSKRRPCYIIKESSCK